MKVILNKCYGGFGLSPVATMMYAKKKGVVLYPYNSYGANALKFIKDIGNCDRVDYFFTKDYGDKVRRSCIDWTTLWYPDKNEMREDLDLIQIVEELGEKADGWCSKLKVVEIPDTLSYVIDYYDGIETLHENVQTW